jgi:hypothetical protein
MRASCTVSLFPSVCVLRLFPQLCSLLPVSRAIEISVRRGRDSDVAADGPVDAYDTARDSEGAGVIFSGASVVLGVAGTKVGEVADVADTIRENDKKLHFDFKVGNVIRIPKSKCQVLLDLYPQSGPTRISPRVGGHQLSNYYQ